MSIVINFIFNILTFLGSFFGFDLVNENSKLIQPTQCSVDLNTLEPLKSEIDSSKQVPRKMLSDAVVSYILIGLSGSIALYLCKGLIVKFLVKPAATAIFTEMFNYFPDLKAFFANLAPTPHPNPIIRLAHVFVRDFPVPIHENLVLRVEYIVTGIISRTVSNTFVQWTPRFFRLTLLNPLIPNLPMPQNNINVGAYADGA